MSKPGNSTRTPDSETPGNPLPRQSAPPASRIPTQPRERRPGLAALGLLIVLACGLGTAYLVNAAGERVSAVQITQRIAPGQKIPADALTEVQVAKDSNLKYVPWEQRGVLTGKYSAAVEIPAGTLLTGPMLTDAAGLAGDQAVVGLALKGGQFPPGLKAGDRVRVVGTGRDAAKSAAASSATTQPGASGSSELAGSAIVREVFRPTNGDVNAALSLSVIVPASAASGVTQAASSGDVALVLLPSAP